jgi:hypothetical protein
MGTVVVSGKALGRRKPLFEDFSVPVPPGDRADGAGDGGLTLRDLVSRIVRHEVDAFHDRQERRQFLRSLSAREIERSVEGGKVDPGGRLDHTKVDPDEAVAAALQGFEDGLYLVVLDGQEQRDLDAPVYPRPDSRITFVRLVFLAGA